MMANPYPPHPQLQAALSKNPLHPFPSSAKLARDCVVAVGSIGSAPVAAALTATVAAAIVVTATIAAAVATVHHRVISALWFCIATSPLSNSTVTGRKSAFGIWCKSIY